ncbi:MAG: YraN family protein [Anaerolineaceae bacterium]|nr:YraN family protein [Anaerolineaceae bacterium]
MENHIAIGKKGEEIASAYLVGQGYEIIQRNYRCEFGEIDIIAKSYKDLIFVEVKARVTHTFGYPEESITNRKKEHLINTAMMFLSENIEFGDFAWQIDVIAIRFMTNSDPEIKWYQNAIT